MKSEERNLDKQFPDDLDDDVIVIKKSWLIAAGVGMVTFILGGLAGYFLATSTYGLSARQAGAVLPAGQDDAAVVEQPAEPPARLDNVSADDDPYLGPEDAPVTIIEFSDFR
jgi:protein-disulfide isomerase